MELWGTYSAVYSQARPLRLESKPPSCWLTLSLSAGCMGSAPWRSLRGEPCWVVLGEERGPAEMERGCVHGHLPLTSRGGLGSLELHPGELGGHSSLCPHCPPALLQEQAWNPSSPYPRLLGLGHCPSGHRQEDPPDGSSQACPSCPNLGHLRYSNA